MYSTHHDANQIIYIYTLFVFLRIFCWLKGLVVLVRGDSSGAWQPVSSGFSRCNGVVEVEKRGKQRDSL